MNAVIGPKDYHTKNLRELAYASVDAMIMCYVANSEIKSRDLRVVRGKGRGRQKRGRGHLSHVGLQHRIPYRAF